MKATDFDCHPKRLGLTEDERAMLTGFSWRMASALAHLREAWCSADNGNKVAIEEALKVLLSRSHSMQEQARIAVKILLHGHGRGDEMLRAIKP